MMVKINLLPVKAKQRQYNVVYQMVVGGVVLAGVFFFCGIWHFLQKREEAKYNAEIASLQKEIAELNRLIGEVKQFEDKKAELTRKLGVINSLKDNKVGPVRFLEELSVTIPKKVWVLSVQESTIPPASHQVKMTGEAISDEIIAEFMTKLEESEYFSNVNLGEARTGGERSGVPIQAFSLTCDFSVPQTKPAGQQTTAPIPTDIGKGG
jgi:type IV pilus assembly protein PilN